MSRNKARKVYDRCKKMIREQTEWQGKAPTVIRVSFGDYLRLVEHSLTDDAGNLKNTSIKVKPADK